MAIRAVLEGVVSSPFGVMLLEKPRFFFLFGAGASALNWVGHSVQSAGATTSRRSHWPRVLEKFAWDGQCDCCTGRVGDEENNPKLTFALLCYRFGENCCEKDN